MFKDVRLNDYMVNPRCRCSPSGLQNFGSGEPPMSAAVQDNTLPKKE